MAIAVLVLMGFALVAPPRLSVMPGWLLAALEGLLLLALILGDPGASTAPARGSGGRPSPSSPSSS